MLPHVELSKADVDRCTLWEGEKLILKTVKKGGKNDAFTTILRNKILEEHEVLLNATDSNVGSKAITITMSCEHSVHFQVSTPVSTIKDQSVRFTIMRKGRTACECGE
jgi:hypothetical protein